MANNQRSHFTFTKAPDFDQELKKLKATPKAIEKAISEEFITTANVIRNHIIKSMRSTPRITRPKKNRVTGSQSGNYNWMSGGKLHIPSSPGYAPAVDTGDLIKSIKMDVRLHEVEIGSNLKGKKGKYPIFLEFGTENMEARPWLEPAYMVGKRDFYTNIRRNVINSIRRAR
jgi:HK97 gp10 family phage protein